MNRPVGPLIFSDGSTLQNPYDAYKDFVMVENVDTASQTQPQSQPHLDKISFNNHNEQNFQNSTKSVAPVVNKPLTESIAETTNDWVAAFFSWVDSFIYDQISEGKEAAKTSLNSAGKLPSTPKLEAPSRSTRAKQAEALLALKRQLARDLEEIRETDEDFKKSTNSNNDAAILRALFIFALRQKELKQKMSTQHSEKLLEIQKQKQKTNNKKFTLEDNLVANTKTSKTLDTVNTGASYALLAFAAYGILSASGTISAAAAGIATAPLAGTLATVGAISQALGASAGITSQILAVLQGGTTIANSYTKYHSDQLSGEIFSLKENSKKMDSKINDQITDLKALDEQVVQLLKSIRALIDNHNEAVHAFSKFN